MKPEAKPTRWRKHLMRMPFIGAVLLRKEVTGRLGIDRFFIIETLNLLLWFFLGTIIGGHLWLPFALLAVSLYLAIVFVNSLKNRIPHALNIALFIVALMFLFMPFSIPHTSLTITQNDRLIGFLIGVVLYVVFGIIEKRKQVVIFLSSDVILIGISGLLLGWLLLLFGIGVAAISGVIWLIVHDFVLKKPKVKDFPFGPFLAGAFIVMLIAGIDIIVWYLDLFT